MDIITVLRNPGKAIHEANFNDVKSFKGKVYLTLIVASAAFRILAIELSKLRPKEALLSFARTIRLLIHVPFNAYTVLLTLQRMYPSTLPDSSSAPLLSTSRDDASSSNLEGNGAGVGGMFSASSSRSSSVGVRTLTHSGSSAASSGAISSDRGAYSAPDDSVSQPGGDAAAADAVEFPQSSSSDSLLSLDDKANPALDAPEVATDDSLMQQPLEEFEAVKSKFDAEKQVPKSVLTALESARALLEQTPINLMQFRKELELAFITLGKKPPLLKEFRLLPPKGGVQVPRNPQYPVPSNFTSPTFLQWEWQPLDFLSTFSSTLR